MQNLKLIKFAQSLKIGTDQEYYFHCTQYDIVLNGIDVHIRRKKDGKTISSTLMNSPWFEHITYENVFEKESDAKATVDSPAAKAKAQSRKGPARSAEKAETAS